MSFVGLEPERLGLDWVSASEGERFARIVQEFTQSVKELGPIRWKADGREEFRLNARSILSGLHAEKDLQTAISTSFNQIYTKIIQEKALELLSNGAATCVIGYEVGPRERTRPVFVYRPEDTEKLVWNEMCTHNLTAYLPAKFEHRRKAGSESNKPIAIVVKPCDSRAINVHLVEQRYQREDIYIIGIACPGVQEPRPDSGMLRGKDDLVEARPQARCQSCDQRMPFIYDTLVGEVDNVRLALDPTSTERLKYQTDPDLFAAVTRLPQDVRLEFWLSQFDQCIRCYACRQVCPMCNCPTCLYERDDSLWVGMGIRVNEKRTFHLGRAYHLAGRCVGCNECERVCPAGIPISLLNQCLVNEMQQAFWYTAGLAEIPHPLVTTIGEKED
jgi:ferredoxin